MELPKDVSQITTEWVAEALCQRKPGIAVRDVVVDEIIYGSATKILIEVDHDATGMPSTLCVKGGFVEAQREMSSAAYANEARFYTEAAQLVPATPAWYYAAVSNAGDQAIVIMDNLRATGCRFGAATSPLTPAEAAEVLRLQASWHASFWESQELARLTKLLPGHAALVQVIDVLTAPAHWDRHLSQPKAEPVPEQYRDSAAVKAGMRRLWELDETTEPHTLIHGDTHVGNLYWDAGGRPGYLDWQTAGGGSWAHDVATFLGGALTVEDRRAYEQDLLRGYLRQLNTAAPSAQIGWDQGWLSYRQHLLHGFLWVLTPEEMQPEPITAANTERYSAAVDDHDTLGLLSG